MMAHIAYSCYFNSFVQGLAKVLAITLPLSNEALFVGVIIVIDGFNKWLDGVYPPQAAHWFC